MDHFNVVAESIICMKDEMLGFQKLDNPQTKEDTELGAKQHFVWDSYLGTKILDEIVRLDHRAIVELRPRGVTSAGYIARCIFKKLLYNGKTLY